MGIPSGGIFMYYLLNDFEFDVKFVIVAPEDKRNKFENEMQKFPYRTMKDKYKFVSYEELIAEYHNRI